MSYVHIAIHTMLLLRSVQRYQADVTLCCAALTCCLLVSFPVFPVHTDLLHSFTTNQFLITLRASEAAAPCIVIAPVCLCVCLFVVCHHDNLKLRTSILTKLGLQVKVVTISS